MYEHIYSALCEWNLKRWNGDDYMASWMTACGLAGALTMNTALAFGVLAAVYGPLPSVPKWIFFSIPIGYILLNYKAFVQHDRYVAIVRRFLDRPDAERRRITVLAWVYVLASYGMPIVFAFSMAALTQR